MRAQIAQPCFPAQRQLPLLFPMVQEAEPRQQAWQQAASAVAAEARAGERVVFLCEGDCSLFASSSYLLLALKAEAPELPIRVIPGITAALPPLLQPLGLGPARRAAAGGAAARSAGSSPPVAAHGPRARSADGAAQGGTPLALARPLLVEWSSSRALSMGSGWAGLSSWWCPQPRWRPRSALTFLLCFSGRRGRRCCHGADRSAAGGSHTREWALE